MAFVRTLALLFRGGKNHPPGTEFHDFTEAEAATFARFVEKIAGKAPRASGKGAEPVEAQSPPQLTEGISGPAQGDGEVVGIDSAETRVEQVRDAIDLLEAPADFTKAGRPKVSALAEIVDFTPTADEITTALALREEMGL